MGARLAAGRYEVRCLAHGRRHGPVVARLRVAAERPARGTAAAVVDLSTAQMLRFDRTLIRARAGRVTLRLKNTTPLQHNVALRGPGVDVDGPVVGQGQTSTLTARLAPGTYRVVCAVPGHEGAGMQARLVVSAAAPRGPEPAAGPDAPAPAGPADAPDAPAGGEVRLTTASLLAFDRAHATVRAGRVTVWLTNTTPLEHNVALRGPGVAVEGPVVGSGGTTSVSADLAPGDYTVLCAVAGHEGAGMRLTLTVVAGPVPPAGPDPVPPPGAGLPGPPQVPPAPAPPGGPLALVTSGMFGLTPGALSAPAGPVTITLANASPLEHNIALRGPGGIIAQGPTVGGGGTSGVTADLAPGVYTFLCTVAGHEAAGMTGALTVGAGPAPPPPPAPVTGQGLFRANCGGCHRLRDAGTTGTVGPDLDDRRPDRDRVRRQMIRGEAPMPSFAGTLTDAEIDTVAGYVAAAVGRSG
jgi:plastocyanin